MFPKKSGIKLTNENSILDRTLIQESTNKQIRKKKPHNYTEIMKQELGSEEKVKTVLETHLIDEKTFNAMRSDDYDEFLNAREELMLNEMMNKIEL